jgi:hypothetical protein
MSLIAPLPTTRLFHVAYAQDLAHVGQTTATQTGEPLLPLRGDWRRAPAGRSADMQQTASPAAAGAMRHALWVSGLLM